MKPQNHQYGAIRNNEKVKTETTVTPHDKNQEMLKNLIANYKKLGFLIKEMKNEPIRQSLDRQKRQKFRDIALLKHPKCFIKKTMPTSTEAPLKSLIKIKKM